MVSKCTDSILPSSGLEYVSPFFTNTGPFKSKSTIDFLMAPPVPKRCLLNTISYRNSQEAVLQMVNDLGAHIADAQHHSSQQIPDRPNHRKYILGNGRPFTSAIGFGRSGTSAANLVPRPPARMITVSCLTSEKTPKKCQKIHETQLHSVDVQEST